MDDFAAPLLNQRLWFGKYPTPEELDIIVAEGFTHIINLCTPEEVTWDPYQVPQSSKIKVIFYPFEDGKTQPLSETSSRPLEWTTFSPFIKRLQTILRTPTNKMYIHCKGGHGRSPTISAIVCGLMENKHSTTILKEVHAAHQSRKIMLDKWRKLGAPQRAKQKILVRLMLD